MPKRILYIIIGAVLILGLLLALWFWFFNRQGSNVSNSNLFGTGQDRGNTSGGTGTGGNGQAPIGSNAGTGAGGSSGSGSGSDVGSNIQNPINQGGGSNDFGPYIPPSNPGDVFSSGANWSTPSSGGSSWIVFNPTPINALNDDTVSGTPYITQVLGANGKPISLLSGLGVLIGGCIIQYGITHLAVKISPGVVTDYASALLTSVSTIDNSTNASTQGVSITDCLVRTLGKIAVQQITDSTVNWINSGFDGKPAFVQDFNKFFTDVADQAAGTFIQNNANFAFLCSPFQLQVRIAIAQSYARRNNAPSCTLTQVAQNIDNFFGSGSGGGGWQNLISFTSVPSNNAFGAFLILQGQFNAQQQQAIDTASQKLAVNNGFLSVTKCDPPGSKTNCKDTTPGSIVEAQLQASINADISSLQLGNSIDQILSALQNALINKLMSGLSNRASASTGATNNPSQTQAEALMSEMQGDVGYAQQYASVEQRTITDIQTAQQNLNTLQNCWMNATSSPNLSPTQVAQANTGAADAASKIAQLEVQVGLYNARIATANGSIAALQELQTDLLMASVAADVTRVKNNFNTIKSTGNPQIYVAVDVTTAQQDRDTVQSNMSVLNIQTSTQLQQCYALGH